MNKDTVKKIITDSIRVLAFAIAFLLILELLSQTVFSAENSAGQNKRMADAYSFVEDEPNTTDIICLGSSDMYSGFVPITLWEQFGYTSTVSCCSHQTINEALTLLKKARETQDIKLVMLEVDTLYDGRGHDNVIRRENNLFENLFEKVDPSIFEMDVETRFPIFTYHNSWKLDNTKSKRRKYSHGYIFNKTVVKIPKSDYMEYTDEKDYPIPSNIVALKLFAEYCKQENLELVFVEMPSLTSWNHARHNAVSEISEELGVELLDLNFSYDEIGIDQTNCFRDKGNHLTYEAAVKTTVYLGNYIKENYDLEDHRNDERYSVRWNSDAENFKKYYKIEK